MGKTLVHPSNSQLKVKFTLFRLLSGADPSVDGPLVSSEAIVALLGPDILATRVGGPRSYFHLVSVTLR